jgi:anthranilate phosphoribosyltransferase
MVNEILRKIVEGEYCDENSMKEIAKYLSGINTKDTEKAAFLSALYIRGESLEEISGFSKGLRSLSSLNPLEKISDIVGTGGDMKGTINVSTAAALVCSSLGVRIGKHGNRGITGKSGGADFMEMSGYKFQMTPQQIENQVKEHNFVFILASMYNSAFGSFTGVRQKIKHRTIFNLMGPITNPLNPEKVVLGCTEPQFQNKFAQVLKLQGKSAMVVRGYDGMDEISFNGKSSILHVNSSIKETIVDSHEITGFNIDQEQVTGNSKEEMFIKTLNGIKGTGKDAASFISLNVSPCLILNGLSDSFEDGYKLSMKAIKSGRAFEKLNEITEGRIKEVVNSVL